MLGGKQDGKPMAIKGNPAGDAMMRPAFDPGRSSSP
jgi:hypothetical protein